MKSGRVIVTTSWNDGHPLDRKVCSILKENKVEGTIYIPIKNPENEIMSNDSLRELSKDFEIGEHTYNHAILTDVVEDQMPKELAKSKKLLENAIGKDILSPFVIPVVVRPK